MYSLLICLVLFSNEDGKDTKFKMNMAWDTYNEYNFMVY